MKHSPNLSARNTREQKLRGISVARVHLERLDSAGAENLMAMTKVFERLYVGDAGDADRLAVTNPFGITAVVNVSTEMIRSYCTTLRKTIMKQAI